MPTTPLFPLPEGLELTSISDTPEELLVCVTSHRSSSLCPQCAMPSSAIHSSYHRHPRDLPCVGRPIRLVFTVRKFFCRNPNCSRKVFAERLPDFLEASSRLTKRLRTSVQDIGFATCGKGGESLELTSLIDDSRDRRARFQFLHQISFDFYRQAGAVQYFV